MLDKLCSNKVGPGNVKYLQASSFESEELTQPRYQSRASNKTQPQQKEFDIAFICNYAFVELSSCAANTGYLRHDDTDVVDALYDRLAVPGYCHRPLRAVGQHLTGDLDTGSSHLKIIDNKNIS